MTALTRRELLRASLGVGALGMFASACGSADVVTALTGNAEPGVAYWNLFSGGDGDRMNEMLAAFRKQHPDIHLRATTLTWGAPYYTKVAMATAGGAPPDIAVIHMSRLPQFAPSGLLRPFSSSELQRIGVSGSTIAPALWKKANVNGKVYAVPLDTHPLVMYYNVPQAKKAGLLGSDGRLKNISGADAWYAALAAAKKANGHYGLVVDTEDVNPWRLWWALQQRQGGRLFDDKGQHLELDEDKALRALEFLQQLTKRGLAPAATNDQASLATFQSGRATFYWNGEWNLPTFQAAKMNFDMVPFPSIFDGKQTWADSHAFFIPHGAAHVDKALTFIGAMLKESLTWAKGGHIPAYTPVRESAAYHKLLPQAHYASEINHVVYDPDVWFAGAAGELETRAGAVFAGVLDLSRSPRSALDEFKSDMKRLLSLPKPT